MIDGGAVRLERVRRRRRWLWVLGGAVALLAGVAASLWFLWLPHYRPALRDSERYGVDVSHHQGQVDWRRVATDEIEFAYIKATEGGDFTDRRFQENWEGAAQAGLQRGAYHFFTLCTPGRTQARHFLAVVSDTDGALPPAVDLELAGNCSARPERAAVHREVRAFMERVEAEMGQELLLYVGDDFERRYRIRGPFGRPLWHLRFLRRPDVEGWEIWQVMGFAHVDGIDGDVDLDVMRPLPTLRSSPESGAPRD